LLRLAARWGGHRKDNAAACLVCQTERGPWCLVDRGNRVVRLCEACYAAAASANGWTTTTRVTREAEPPLGPLGRRRIKVR
jgi:hypothetical protein